MPTDSVCFSTVSPVRSPDISNPQHKTNIYIWNCSSIKTSNCKCCPAWCWFSTKDLTKCAILAPFLSPPLPTISFDSLTLPEWHSDVADVFQVPKDNSSLLFLLLRFFIAFMFDQLLTSVLYALGRTDLIALKSLIDNIAISNCCDLHFKLSMNKINVVIDDTMRWARTLIYHQTSY